MNKKSQFYIITAVILLAMTSGFFMPKLSYDTDTKFREVGDNYIREASFAANTGNLDDFSRKFVDYAGIKEQNFGLAYIYAKGRNVTVLNLIKKTIYINEFKLDFNQTLTIGRESSITLTKESDQYFFNTSDAPKISAFFYSETGSTKKVYVKNE